MAAPNARTELSRIRQVRRGFVVAGALFMLWWIGEFATYGGRAGGFDAFDFLFLVIVGALGWLLYQGWRARCPQCGNPFFINAGLPVGFHISAQCPYCGAQLDEFEELRR